MTSETIENGVAKVLHDHPEARNSYNWLWYWYCKDIAGIQLYVPFEALNQGLIPSVESITRACRKVQNDQARYKPSFEVQQSRAEKETQVREWATKKSTAVSAGWQSAW